ncbi:MAG: radical SAM protein [Candidatus Zixiibacteriota bacterium]|nr:MAG: radical SAM protein [candidate division Zixibacteria bacterium]
MSQKRDSRPEMVVWEITRRCNLSCPHCYTAATTKDFPEFNTGQCKEIIDALIGLGTTDIGWTGGEPLLRNDLEELMVYARERGAIKSGITTNGILLDVKRAHNLKQAGLNSLQISIDGTTPERNFRIRRATDEEFHHALEAVRICVSLDMKLHIAMVLGKENLDDAWEMLKLAHREGVEFIRFCGFVPVGRGRHKQSIERLRFDSDLSKIREFVDEVVQLESPKVYFDPAVGPVPPRYQFHVCNAGVQTMYLNCLGDVYPCTSLLNKRFIVGNVNASSLADIWNDPKMTEVAQLLREEIHGQCSSCRHFHNCRGACRGVTYAHTGDMYASFPLCLKW